MMEAFARSPARAAVVSLLLIVPCEWHRRIEAGDLGSHVYNAWLASMAQRGLAPGVFVVHQWNNIAFDVMLSTAIRWVGLPLAARVAVPVCVLVFFWGTFAFIGAVAERPPWALVPLLAMLAYGWTLHAGFINYYLSIGLGAFAAALLIAESPRRTLAGLGVLAVSYIAHPLGFVWGAGAAFFAIAGRRLHGKSRNALGPIIALLLLALIGLGRAHYRTIPRAAHWYAESGLDQFYVFGRADRIVALGVLVVGAAALSAEVLGHLPDWRNLARLRTPLELYALTAIVAVAAPYGVFLPQYPVPLGWLNERLTILCAVMLICLVGMTAWRRPLAIATSLLAVVFFTVDFRTTGLANRIEDQARALVRTVPEGSRVVYSRDIQFNAVEPSKFFNHLIDRACVGWCFLFSNYEPPTKQFRVRVKPGSPVQSDSPALSEGLETWHPTTAEMPVWVVYQPQRGDTLLAIRPMPPRGLSGK
jgi:hypothetical protein